MLVWLVITPTVLLLSLGIILMFLGSYEMNLLMGILIVSFVAWVVTGVILVLVFVRREASLSELQADFVSKVSHELRTPLTAVRLFAETLVRKKDDPETVAKCVSALDMETRKLSERIERLLDWGRMEAGRKYYDLKPESVRGIVQGAVDAFSALRTDEIDFAYDVQDDLPLVIADRGAMVDALVNLLTNAHKYGGTPAVVRLHARKDPKGHVVIEVTDNGAGIPPLEHPRIFEKFYRIDDRLSRRRDGSGLGLAIVKHVVRGHNGSVTVDSTEGKGSTFRVVLAAATPRDLATAQPTLTARDSASPDTP
jgi:two-component system phosphate regulon sensor histidine kinase PhoR